MSEAPLQGDAVYEEQVVSDDGSQRQQSGLDCISRDYVAYIDTQEKKKGVLILNISIHEVI